MEWGSGLEGALCHEFCLSVRLNRELHLELHAGTAGKPPMAFWKAGLSIQIIADLNLGEKSPSKAHQDGFVHDLFKARPFTSESVTASDGISDGLIRANLKVGGLFPQTFLEQIQ